jgi:uncharacterized RmlC-like cupin family protein
VDPCRVVRGGESYSGLQGLSYFAGVSAQSTGSRSLCLHALTIPPGGRARAHLHHGHESAIYMISGDAVVWSGEELRERAEAHAGDFVYIPAGTPHLPVNASSTEACVALVARTDPNEQESVVLLPELDGLPHLH